MNQDSYTLQQRVLRGEDSVYPGHQVVVGLLIMDVYPDVAAASRRTERGCADALTNSAIPGSGGAVRSALDYLEMMSDGRLNPQEAIARARITWMIEGNTSKVTLGQEQADRFAEEYIAKATAWLNLPVTIPSSP